MYVEDASERYLADALEDVQKMFQIQIYVKLT